MAVGSDRQVELLVVERPHLRQLADELDHAMPEQRLATRDANLLYSLRHEQSHHTQVIRHWQVGIDRALIPRPAVDTLIVAAVGDRDPQIGDGAAVLVAKTHWDFTF